MGWTTARWMRELAVCDPTYRVEVCAGVEEADALMVINDHAARVIRVVRRIEEPCRR